MLEYNFVTGDPEKDFLEQNPWAKFFPFVEKIRNSKPGRENGILWSLFMVEHPKSLIYYKAPYEERVERAEQKYHVVYMEDCVPYKEDFIKASMHPHEIHYKLMYDAWQRQLWGLGGLESEDLSKFFDKVEKTFKALEIAEEKYNQGEEQIKTTAFKGGKEAGGLFKQRPGGLFQKAQ